ncbi:hypothetical protein BDBG_08936 [Blastomyces gilchristii SLH14081]|uniref:Aminoglycoside phosphotransferase domain-containing protein n=1 Tax=Blastomyces gilchristii (strain SLH14081) TaxID=559298 RepID=A0A179V315_BLAGS|nr:uncharacterized protein BDBG_08936 [Blastomyces gilchristii SLH14081]OAT13807.1 hypothetical protein BDBG_08936 [Blastomyces gilchristii SLH14081]
MGGLHLVRLLIFNDNTKWIARIQLRECNSESIKHLLHEVHTLALIREQTRIPVPQVFGYELSRVNIVGAAFMIMEFIPGNTAMDAFGGWHVHKGEIPSNYKAKFFRAIAGIQVEMASIRFPKIGMIVKREDGTYDIDPIPGLGGPFKTASDYFEAWANHAKFPRRESDLRRQLPPNLSDDIIVSIQQFPCQLKKVTRQIVRLNTGPFPLCHMDYRHSNVIVEGDYNILSVIDWENACTVPWELMAFPLFLTIIPPPMDAPWNYDSNGLPKDQDVRQLWEEREDYVRMVQYAEEKQNVDNSLSTTLASQDIQSLASAVKLYLEPGKIGLYCKVLDCFRVDLK